ncbi:MAG: peptidase domain-containing ABC transporter [Lachnospiraceae bacterium]|nr:peptidase domain-containing ABC transporter [Lachnospiraceae bacterium]
MINIRQHDISDCAPTCLAIITKFYGGIVSIAKMREIMGTNTTGTSLKGFAIGAESLGFKTETLKCISGMEDSMDNIPLPCVAHIVIDEDLLHYVVILKVEKNKIIISDPAQGIVKLPREKFWKLEYCKVGMKEYRWSGVIMTFLPTKEFEKKYQKFSKGMNLFKLLRPNKKLCGYIIIVSLIYTIINIGSAFYYKILIDKILPAYAFQNLVLISEAFLLLVIAKVVLNVLRVNMSLTLGKHIHNNLAMEFYEHILKLPQKFFDNRKVGELSSRFQDVEIIQTLLSKIVLTVFVDAIAVIVAGIILYCQNKYMFLGVIVICILYMIVVLTFRKKYAIYSKNQLVNEAHTMAGILDFLNGVMTVKLYNAKIFACETVEKRFADYLGSAYKLGTLENLQFGLKSWIGFTGEIIILCIGAYNIFLDKLTIGELITFNVLIVYFFDPIRNLIDLQTELQTAFVAEERIQEIMDLDIEETVTMIDRSKEDFSFLNKDICFENVIFGYGTGKNVLQKLSMEVKGASKIAIIGESGSGKSTIVKLLMKLYKPQEGSISIGGINIEEISTEKIRDKIAYVSQETFLFNISIMDNLLLGNERVKRDDVFLACKTVEIHEYIMGLPLQYNTILEEGGSNLSSGQRQRLMLARAILRKPYILILDEATSNLNYGLEKIIDKAIKKYLTDSTIIIVTHRANIAKSCDIVYILEKGIIKEHGCHQDLITKGNLYCKLLGQ